jgi:hypothetical protein
MLRDLALCLTALLALAYGFVASVSAARAGIVEIGLFWVLGVYAGAAFAALLRARNSRGR